MCRFIAYLGKPILLDDVLYKPKNSLIQQSFHAKEIEEPLNGDGFGIGWYVHHIDNTPALFRSIQPAWNDLNLTYLAKKILSGCFFAHVRAASTGDVAITNCHPFHYQQQLFMHNGDIGGFAQIKRYLRRTLSDEIYDWIKGETDSEHFFALFLDKLIKQKLSFSAENVAYILPEIINDIETIRKQHQLSTPSYINAVFSNGTCMVAIRYVSSPDLKPASLHFTSGSQYEYRDGMCHMYPAVGKQNNAVLIASEKLTNHKAEWIDVPENSMVLVDESLQITLKKM